MKVFWHKNLKEKKKYRKEGRKGRFLERRLRKEGREEETEGGGGGGRRMEGG